MAEEPKTAAARPALPAQPLSEKMNDVRLCQVIQGVEAIVRIGPKSFRLVVLAEELMERFGADRSAESWIDAYERNAAHIERLACEEFRASGDSLVIVRRFVA
jgi:hypothetical protein